MSADPRLISMTSTKNRSTVITFHLGQQVYALPISSIVRIVEMVAITPIPRTNHSVEGVINYKGVTVPVVNMRRHLGLPAVPFGLDTHIVIAQIGERMMGLIVDQVQDVSEFADIRLSDLDSLLPEGLGQVPMLQGLVQTPQGAVLILDLDALFSEEQSHALVQFADALSGAVAEQDVSDQAVAPPPENGKDTETNEQEQDEPLEQATTEAGA